MKRIDHITAYCSECRFAAIYKQEKGAGCEYLLFCIRESKMIADFNDNPTHYNIEVAEFCTLPVFDSMDTLEP